MELISSKNDAGNNLFILITIMIFTTLFVCAVAISIFYGVNFNEQKRTLSEKVYSQARNIEANIIYQATFEDKKMEEIENIIYLQLNVAFNNYYGFRESGEYVFAKKIDDNIIYLFNNRSNEKNNIIPFKSNLDIPMEMALEGSSGTMDGVDSNGNRVLAAYDYIKGLNVGIVAKIDIAEINKPFYKAIIIISLLGIISVIFAALLFHKIRNNILQILNNDRNKLQKANKKLKFEILEHNETEAKLRNSQRTLKLQLQKSPIPMIIISEDKHVEFYNDKFTEVFGYKKSDFPNVKSIWSKFYPDKEYRYKAYSFWLKSVQAEIQHKQSMPVKTWAIRAKDGSLKQCEVYVVVSSGSSFIVFNDVTAQRELETQLIDEKNRAEELSEVKSTFLSKISHEIRTPINGVLGMTELLLGTDINDEQLKFIKTIKISGSILLELVNDLLDISKIEANMLTLETFNFNIKSLLEDFIEIQKYKTKGKNLKLTLNIEDNVPILLKGDPGRLRQILLNLVGNAFKFTKSGEIALFLTLIEDLGEEVLLEFVVKDSGLGIPKNRIDFIFDKFIQADLSTTRKYGGSGLGLTICKELVEVMGGVISVESQEGVGSTFKFTIKLLKQTSADKKAVFNTLLTHNLDPIEVLFYCDNREKFKYYADLMKYWNVNLKVEYDTKDIIRVLNSSRENLKPIKTLLIDIEESKWSDFCNFIKKDDLINDTKIGILTDYGGRGDVNYLYQLGFSSYLSKPIKKADLHDILLALGNGSYIDDQLITKHSIRDILWNNIVILIVDDNKINQRVASGILEKNGFIVDVVNDGFEAIEYLSDRRYHLVLMDCNMPKLDGYNTTRIIRSGDSTVLDHNIPIIAMTANFTESDKEKCFKSGMNEFISKPIEPESLIELIHRNLR